MSAFDYINTDAIPDFAIIFDGVGAMHPNYRKYATQQTAIAQAVTPFTSSLSLALWHGGIHFQKHVRLDLAPFDRKEEVERSVLYVCSQNHFAKRVFYDGSVLKIPNRNAKCRALAGIIDREWETFAANIGSNAISISHICNEILSDDWSASGRITDFHLNRKRDKAAALLFEASHSGIVLSLAIINKTMTWTKLPVYKTRKVSTRPLYCYGTRITWPSADSVRIMGRFHQPDLVVPVNGFEIDFAEYDRPHVRSERCGGGLFYYDNTNSPFVLAQAERVSEFVLRSLDKIALSTSTSLPTREENVPKFIADYVSRGFLK